MTSEFNDIWNINPSCDQLLKNTNKDKVKINITAQMFEAFLTWEIYEGWYVDYPLYR